MQSKKKYIVAASFVLAAGALGLAYAHLQGPEAGLVEALKLKKGTTERQGDSGKAIRAYMEAGLVNKRPNLRADYTDYYLLKKPATFMGHQLVVIEEEYMSRFIGCCVSPGAGVTVKVVGRIERLEQFAEENKCGRNENVDLQGELRFRGLKNKIPRGNYVSLSCRERDLLRD